MAKRKRKRFQYIRQRFPKKMQKKLVMLFVAIVLAFVGLIGKITHINATNGEKYTKIVLDQQKYNSRLIPFKRGDIVDRNGTTIATSERVYNVVLDANVMLASDKETIKSATIEQVKDALELVFEIEPSVVDGIIVENPEGRYNVLKKKVPYAKAREFQALKKEVYVDENGKEHEKYPYISCIWLEEDYIRSYPYNTLASDVIGFTVAGNLGNAGIEASYNSILNGQIAAPRGYRARSSRP